MIATLERRAQVVETPEGVRLPFDIAPLGSRLVAFLLDFALAHAAVILLSVISMASSSSIGGEGGFAIAMIAGFFIRNFYFIFFEMRWAGKTPGKRALGLRVIARDGRTLSGEAVIARNLTRDLETLLPLVALLAPGLIVPDAPGWAALAGVLWLIVVAFLPVFNRQRLRAGDLIGGTLVVAAPRHELLQDLAEAEIVRWDQPIDVAAQFRFTPEQLDLYGIRELQVLESVLRTGVEGRSSVEHEAMLARISEKIRAKIDWPPVENLDDEAFLNAFYRAQRARLEQQMLFGKRRERKVK